ncbi:MAG: glucokinase [Chlamydiae bacterium RIFCSPHIGHO2_12_FULL_49_9]|nr:MAG: glucokinase [Chlamydiae bacterium RIFCSPHIGHO2_12_FULL_49_9]
MILAGDVGGTHTRLALFEKGQLREERKFSSRNYKGLEEIVEEYLSLEKKNVSVACFGIAGPVRDGKCKATNLPWEVDASELSLRLKIEKVSLLNDLEANAHGLKMLKPEELFLLQKGNPKQSGNRALISAGTGLGEAGLFWDGKAHHPFACEGGHADFAPRNELEIELLLYLKKKFGHVSYERVVSGPGLHAIYEFLVESGKERRSEDVKAEMKKKDPSFVVSEFGRENRDLACSKALDLFLSCYGAETGNLALKLLALGGCFIGGGIAPHLAERMKAGFVSSFIDKGRFGSLLETIPVWVVLNDNTALLGAAAYGATL